MKWRAQDHERRQGQRGGSAIGLIVGLLLGLAVALAVALWVTKVPVPFINKVPQRSGDASEAERNRNWDPNAGLGGKGQASRSPAGPASAPPAAAASTTGTATGTTLPPYVPPVPPPLGGNAPPSPAPTATAPTATAPRAAPPSGAAVANAPTPAATSTTATAPAAAAPKPAAASGDPFLYFVQAGAYTKPDDAEQQRARIAMLGFAAKVTEREQVGRTMYRVRVGPFETKDGAETAQSKLQQSGVDAALVRVERSATATAGR